MIISDIQKTGKIKFAKLKLRHECSCANLFALSENVILRSEGVISSYPLANSGSGAPAGFAGVSEMTG